MSEKGVKVEESKSGSNSSSITGSFGRTELRKIFGPSFPDRGIEKKGTKQHDIIVASRSPAVKDGRVLLNSDGSVNKTCSAVRQGLLLFKEDGSISMASKLVQQKQVALYETNASHKVSFEVIDAICKKHNLTIQKDDAEAIILGLNRFDNLPLKNRPANMGGTDKAKKTGDRTLDLKIIDAILNGTQLSALDAKRATKQIEIVLASEGIWPRKFIEQVRAVYTELRDENGHKICRSNAEIVKVKEDESRRFYGEVDRKVTGIKNDGTPDERTIKGQDLIKRAETGLKNDGTPDLRTEKGKKLQKEIESKLSLKNENESKSDLYSKFKEVPQSISEDRKVTGLKNDGFGYDMRTTKGKELHASASMISQDYYSRDVVQQIFAGDRKTTGLKNDGLGYDMRTTKGKELYASASKDNSSITTTETSYSSPSKVMPTATTKPFYSSAVANTNSYRNNYYSSTPNYQTSSPSDTYSEKYLEDTPSYTDTPSSYPEDSSSSYNPSYTYETAYTSGDISYGDYAFCSDYFSNH